MLSHLVNRLSAVFRCFLAGLLHGCCTERYGTQLALIGLLVTSVNKDIYSRLLLDMQEKAAMVPEEALR